jgi:hypothetical protein
LLGDEEMKTVSPVTNPCAALVVMSSEPWSAVKVKVPATAANSMLADVGLIVAAAPEAGTGTSNVKVRFGEGLPPQPSAAGKVVKEALLTRPNERDSAKACGLSTVDPVC